MEDRKTVSLSGELHLLIHAIEGVRELAERLDDSSFHDGTLLLSIASNLVVVRERLRLIDRVVRGVLDPWHLWSPQNEALPAVKDGDDVLLPAWSDAQMIRRLRKDWRSAKRRLRRSKDGA
jgi:hypothetical protein